MLGKTFELLQGVWEKQKENNCSDANCLVSGRVYPYCWKKSGWPHLGCKKKLKNSGINYQPQLVSLPDFWTINNSFAAVDALVASPSFQLISSDTVALIHPPRVALGGVRWVSGCKSRKLEDGVANIWSWGDLCFFGMFFLWSKYLFSRYLDVTMMFRVRLSVSWMY